MATTILYYHPLRAGAAPRRLLLADAVASAFVRSGTAIAAEPAKQAGLAAGATLDPGTLVEVALIHGVPGLEGTIRLQVPLAVAQVAAAAGVGAFVGASPIVLPTVTLAMAQLTAGRIYQRATSTGGGLGKGAGTHSIAITLSEASSVYARIRDADDGTTIVKPAYQIAASAPAGNSNVTVGSVPARAGWHFVDLAAGPNGPWTLGTARVGMGAGVMLGGQSLAVRMLGSVPAATTGTRSSDLGVTINPNTAIYAKYADSSRNSPAPSWTPPQNTGTMDSAGAAKMLDTLVTQLGVSVFLAGAPVGATPIAAHVVGGAYYADYVATMAAVGGFEIAISFIGHSDAQNGSPGRDYRAFLSSFFAGLAAGNSRGTNFRAVVLTIPNITVTGSWGTPTQRDTIRRAGYDYVQREGAADYAGARYVQSYSVALVDGVHQSQQGAITIGDAITNSLAGSDQSAGDGALPAEAVLSGTAAGGTYTAAGKFLAASLNGGYIELPASAKPAIGPVTMGMWFEKVSAPGSLQILVGAGGAAWLGITPGGKLSLNTGNDIVSTASAIGAGFHWLTLEEDHDPFTGTASTVVRLDGAIVINSATSIALRGNSNLGVRDFGGAPGGYTLNPSRVCEFSTWTKLLGSYVPAAALNGSEPHLHAYLPLNGNAIGAV